MLKQRRKLKCDQRTKGRDQVAIMRRGPRQVCSAASFAIIQKSRKVLFRMRTLYFRGKVYQVSSALAGKASEQNSIKLFSSFLASSLV